MGGARRRRRSPEVAEREILAAAEEMLRERPFRDLTVDEVMRRTELSRPSFYVYFRDRHHLVLRVVERFGAEMWTMSERWFEGTGPGGLRAPGPGDHCAAVVQRDGRAGVVDVGGRGQVSALDVDQAPVEVGEDLVQVQAVGVAGGQAQQVLL